MNNFRIRIPDNDVTYYKSYRYKELITDEYLSQHPEIITTRTFTGTSNNLINPIMGSVSSNLLRKAEPVYADGINSLADRSPTPRIISNNICSSDYDEPNKLKLSNICWMWGQFLDHELDLTHTDPTEPANMITPSNDQYPNYTILFDRSVYTGGVTTPRIQTNSISAYIDGTNVYGCCIDRAMSLRRLDGTGKLSTVIADNYEEIPIYNVHKLENATPPGTDPEDFFLCGDIRSNENIHLTAMHTLFIREHNRLCDVVIVNHPEMVGKDELIYQQARRIICGEMQVITYNEFLPAILGKYAPKPSTIYDDKLDPGITVEFSTVGYRLGHSFLPSVLKVGTDSSIELRDAFFRPMWIQENGIDSLLVGASTSICNEFDTKITNAVRNFLFGPPENGHLLDLASLNIQRGRDHGIPDYNTLRVAYGLERKLFSQLTSDVDLQEKLSQTFPSIFKVDPWIGALAEDHLPTAAVGELITEILVDQFTRLCNCDRFWWERDIGLSSKDKDIIKNTTLSAVIKRNIAPDQHKYIPNDVFHVQ